MSCHRESLRRVDLRSSESRCKLVSGSFRSRDAAVAVGRAYAARAGGGARDRHECAATASGAGIWSKLASRATCETVAYPGSSRPCSSAFRSFFFA